MGAGSGIQTEICIKLGFRNILSSDINEEVIDLLKKKKLKTIHSDLFQNIKQEFDLIIFNPPYLPEDKREPKDSKITTTGGKKGYELILRFLKEGKKHLKKGGVILLLFSSLSSPEIIKKEAKKEGYSFKKLNSKKIPFEELFVYSFIISDSS